MGLKTVQVKGAGSQSFPRSSSPRPAMRAGDDFSRGRDFTDGVVTGVYKLQVSAFVNEHVGVIADPNTHHSTISCSLQVIPTNSLFEIKNLNCLNVIIVSISLSLENHIIKPLS